MLRIGTDKSSSGHNYAARYDELFAPWRTLPVVLFEVGVWEGGSLHSWAQYFDHPDATIAGFDVDTWRYIHSPDPRIAVITTDATTPTFAHMADVMPAPWIVIDDGSHREVDQRATFNILWPRLRPGGLYAIEDLHALYWERANPPGADNWLMELARDAIGRGVEQARPDMASIQFSPSLTVLRKRE